jgi:uncharacterized protein YggT (Ycf19 family)
MDKDLNKPIEVPGYLKVSKVVSYLVYFWVMFGIIVLSVRVFLLAFSANPTSGFVEFIYRTSGDYLQPFRAIFLPKQVGETGYLDVAALFAIIMYLLFAWGVSAFTKYIQSKIDETTDAEKEREKKLEKQQAAKRATQARQQAAQK